MTRTVGIIGIGHVGVTTAYTMVTKGLADRLILIDKQADRAAAEALDLADAQAGLPTFTQLIVNDYAALADAEVVIFAAGDISQVAAGGDRNGEIASTKLAIDEVAPQLAQSGFAGVLIDISNPCDVAVNYWQQLLGWKRQRILGTGTGLDTYRMRRAVAEKLGVNLADVRGYNLGEHGASQFTAWSTVYINSTAITAYGALDYAALAEASRQGGWQIFKTKHYTNYGIATIACEMAAAVISDARRVFPCACWDETAGISIGHPAMLGRAGVLSNPELALTAAEKTQYQHSAATIKANLATMQALP
ncbi:L-lactate dehydrogenase [Lacticaseibacillus baoqingensis]|uniref:L-lactate dehydrogenase n=1 Tax=Lacticaseibacillus baoqingensis TaxID=2486013 RepID=A0ABW4E9S7_9LACO|nr:L-lactate dehydrogenase [Lacticaseibacillus baoqingensis]